MTIQRAPGLRTVVVSGKVAGTLTSDPTLAKRYLELGCTFIAVGVLLYAHAARRLAADFLGTPTTTPISAEAR